MSAATTYAGLIACALLFGLGIYAGTRAGQRRWPKLTRLAGLFQIAAFGTCYAVLRPGAGDDGATKIEAARAAARPILLEFYSNY
ncbi:MAG: hypothetical protein V3V08_12980 [Nannocystaceae bacterium]